MKKKLLVGILSLGLLAVPTVVKADGFATVKFEGNTIVEKGNEVKVNIVVDDVKDTVDGVEAFGGYITFDDSVLELVKTEQADNKYPVFINENNNKIAGLDFTMENGIKERTAVYTLTFKAKGEGNTKVTLTDPEVDDRLSEVEYTIKGLDITVKESKPEEVTTTTTTTAPVEKTTTKVEETTKPVETTTVVTTTVTAEEKVVEDAEEEIENADEETDNIIVSILKAIADFFKKFTK